MTSLILITEPQDYSEEAKKLYSQVGTLVLGVDPKFLQKNGASSQVETLVTRLSYQLGQKFLGQFPQLKFLISPTTGSNHIDLDYCLQKGIEVFTLKGHENFLSQITATAEHTLGLILALLRNIPWAHQDVTETGRWERERFKGRSLSGLKLGIIGLGRVGLQVCRFAQALGMSVSAFDPFVEKERFHRHQVLPSSLEDLLKKSDIVSLHAHPGSAPILGKIEFSLMKRGSYLINTARGELLDELSLLQALQTHHIAGAALDVLADENRQNETKEKLRMFSLQSRRLILTPHLGGATREAMAATEEFMAKYFLQILDSRRQHNHARA